MAGIAIYKYVSVYFHFLTFLFCFVGLVALSLFEAVHASDTVYMVWYATMRLGVLSAREREVSDERRHGTGGLLDVM